MSWPFGVRTSVEATALPPGPVAVMTAEVELATAWVVAENVAVVAPAGIVTLLGTVAAELLLDREMGVPPAGAGPAAFTVPWDVLPPITGFGSSCKLTRAP